MTDTEHNEHPFAGMGSHAAREREVAEHARLPPTSPNLRTREAENMRRHVVGDPDRVERGWDEMAERSPRDFQRPHPERMEAARRRTSGFWESQVQIGLEMQRDRVSVRRRGAAGDGSPSWEKLAASGFAEQRRVVIGDASISSHHDPDADPLRLGEQLVDKYKSPRGMGFTHDIRGIR